MGSQQLILIPCRHALEQRYMKVALVEDSNNMLIIPPPSEQTIDERVRAQMSDSRTMKMLKTSCMEDLFCGHRG